MVGNYRLTDDMKVQLYRAYVRSIILYADLVWVNAADHELKKVTSIKTNMLRTIYKLKKAEVINKELSKKQTQACTAPAL